MKLSLDYQAISHHLAQASFNVLAGALFIVTLLTVSIPALAAPGAHGPNGEHLDGPAFKRMQSALPRIETSSESFELVAELRVNELTIIIDRYETNEPVLGASLEVESGMLTATATFRADQGDYVVTDPAMLEALASPGEHALVFTVLAGNDSDLLDSTLIRGNPQADASTSEHDHGHDHAHHDHSHVPEYVLIGAVLASLGFVGFVVNRRRRKADKPQGGV